MKKRCKQLLPLLLTAALALSLAACGGGSGEEIYAQSMASINGMGYVGLTDRFAGVAVAGKTTEIRLDPALTLDAVLVEEGQLVKKGDVLFTYNNESAALSVEQAKLEIEGMKNKITSLNSQIADLTKERDAAASGDKLNYTLEIQSLQADVRETQYSISVKEKELKTLEENAADTQVKSETDGRVTELNRSGAPAEDGSEKPFMTVVETGSLRIRGRLNELNRGAVTEGQTVTVRSRTDDTKTWRGTVQSIDWENPESDHQGDFYSDGPVDEMTASSSYPFYISLENTDGLIIGQHVYIEPGEAAAPAEAALTIPAYFVMDAESDPWVWAADGEKLEKRSVTLGALDEETECYPVLDGLTAADYVVFPEDSLKPGMAVIKEDGAVFNGAADGFSDGVAYEDAGFDSAPEAEALPGN